MGWAVGTGGRLEVAGRLAATLGSWEARGQLGGTVAIEATIAEADPYWGLFPPDRAVLRVGRETWYWSIARSVPHGATITLWVEGAPIVETGAVAS